MTIFKHELRRGKLSFFAWTFVLAFMLSVCVFIYPQISKQMDSVSAMLADMGAFSSIFGMDKLNYGEFIGYFAIECGNILGIGAALYAGLLGISALSQEEKEHTADFLLSHPISRTRIMTEKLCAIFVKLILLNALVIAVSAISILIISPELKLKPLILIFLAYFIMQLQIAAITFGISAFIHRGSLGLGLGISAGSYFLNIISNFTDKTVFLKYFTAFGYTDSADIVANNSLTLKYLLAGIAISVIFIVIGYVKYNKKDIA